MDFPGAIITNTTQPSPPQKPKQHLKIQVGIGVILVAIAATIVVTWPKIKTLLRSGGSPQTIQQGKVSDIPAESHQELFSMLLEYNLKSGMVTQLSSGYIKGDTPVFLPNPPQVPTEDFIYKVEVVSPENELLQDGWRSIPGELLNKVDEKLIFTVRTSYYKNALIRIYLKDNQIIWTGKIT